MLQQTVHCTNTISTHNSFHQLTAWAVVVIPSNEGSIVGLAQVLCLLFQWTTTCLSRHARWYKGYMMTAIIGGGVKSSTGIGWFGITERALSPFVAHYSEHVDSKQMWSTGIFHHRVIVWVGSVVEPPQLHTLDTHNTSSTALQLMAINCSLITKAGPLKFGLLLTVAHKQLLPAQGHYWNILQYLFQRTNSTGKSIK